jgi:hypothetical protein
MKMAAAHPRDDSDRGLGLRIERHVLDIRGHEPDPLRERVGKRHGPHHPGHRGGGSPARRPEPGSARGHGERGQISDHAKGEEQPARDVGTAVRPGDFMMMPTIARPMAATESATDRRDGVMVFVSDEARRSVFRRAARGAAGLAGLAGQKNSAWNRSSRTTHEGELQAAAQMG